MLTFGTAMDGRDPGICLSGTGKRDDRCPRLRDGWRLDQKRHKHYSAPVYTQPWHSGTPRGEQAAALKESQGPPCGAEDCAQTCRSECASRPSQALCLRRGGTNASQGEPWVPPWRRWYCTGDLKDEWTLNNRICYIRYFSFARGLSVHK